MMTIRTETVERCRLCGGAGAVRYAGLQDHIFGAPGRWGAASCVRCGLLWLSPRPVREDVGKVYESYYTHGEATPSGAVFARHFGGFLGPVRELLVRQWRQAHAHVMRRELGYGEVDGARAPWLARVLARVPAVRDGAALGVAGLPAAARGVLLDVGCGNGDFLVRMRELGWSVRGVEPDERAAAFARSRHGLDVRAGQLDDARFPEGTFDAVVLSHVIEHVFDPVALLRECGRVLAPGGTVVVLTPNAASLGHRLLGRAWRGLEPPRHLHVFDPSTMAACARQAGLAVTGLRTSTRMMSRIWYASRSMRRGDREGVPYNTRADYISSFLMAALEDVWRAVQPGAGEELVLTATKGPASEER